MIVLVRTHTIMATKVEVTTAEAMTVVVTLAAEIAVVETEEVVDMSCQAQSELRTPSAASSRHTTVAKVKKCARMARKRWWVGWDSNL